MPGCYLNKKFTKHIDKERVKIIFEIGSRDCLDAIKLSNYFNCKVFAFECNPLAIKICKKNLKSSDCDIKLIEYAAYNKDIDINFYPVTETDVDRCKNSDFVKTDEGKIANIGASSLFKINKNFQKVKFKGNSSFHKQEHEIIVKAIRLDTFMKITDIDTVNLICMDLQGAELMALEGMGDFLKRCKYIITELCTTTEKNGKIMEYYDGQGKVKDVIALLDKNGFKLVEGDVNRFSQDDFMFINQNI